MPGRGARDAGRATRGVESDLTPPVGNSRLPPPAPSKRRPSQETTAPLQGTFLEPAYRISRFLRTAKRRFLSGCYLSCLVPSTNRRLLFFANAPTGRRLCVLTHQNPSRRNKSNRSCLLRTLQTTAAPRHFAASAATGACAPHSLFRGVPGRCGTGRFLRSSEQSAARW